MSAEVLVLSNYTNSHTFAKYFKAYVTHDNYNSFVEEIRISGVSTPFKDHYPIEKDNKKITFILRANENTDNMDYIKWLLYFRNPQQLIAIILLVDVNYSWDSLEKQIFPALSQIPVLGMIFCEAKENIVEFKKSNLSEYITTFYKLNNQFYQERDERLWKIYSPACSKIFKYITSKEQIYDVHFKEPKKMLLELVDDLLDITVEIFFLGNLYEKSDGKNFRTKFFWEIKKVRYNDVIVCYSCSEIQKVRENIKIKVPTICHHFCGASNIVDMKNCHIFHKQDKKCQICFHDIAEHSKFYYEKNWDKRSSNQTYSWEKSQEMHVLEALTTFWLFKDQRPCNFPKLLQILKNKLHLEDETQSIIFRKAQEKFDKKLKEIKSRWEEKEEEEERNTIIIDDVYKNIEKLYKSAAPICPDHIPSIIRDILSKKNYGLEMFEISIKNSDIAKINSSVDELKRKLDEVVEENNRKLDEVVKETNEKLDAVIKENKRKLEEVVKETSEFSDQLRQIIGTSKKCRGTQ